MNQTAFTATLEKQLAQLNREQSIDFGIRICEHLFPDYLRFSAAHKWGDVALLKNTILYCKDAKTKPPKNEELQKLINDVEVNIPDTKDFGDYAGSFALNASASILELLTYLLDGDVKHLLNTSTYMLDHIDFKIAEAGTDLTYEQWDAHPEIIKERLFQLQAAK